jgi:pimeloyl-ACP methyl ester carboxylesterase
LIALVMIVLGLWRLESGRPGVTILQETSGGVPMTLFQPDGAGPAPVVVIAHGFAGSQRMMQSYAITLARNGYLAVTFDFPGHGRNGVPFVADIRDPERVPLLTQALEQAVAWGLARPGADGRLALVGHSMAGDIMARFAAAAPDRVASMVLVSPYLSEQADTSSLENLLLIYGALEPAQLHQQGAAAIAEIAGGEIETAATYGDHMDGSARRLALIGGVEHIGVLYAANALAETLEWLDSSFKRAGQGGIERRGPGLALLYLGILALAWPLSRRLPRLSEPACGAGLGWRRLLPVALAPALLTPLILWKLPSDFLPILLGDYLALHFAVYGLLMALAVWLIRRRTRSRGGCALDRRAALVAIPAVALYAVLAFAVPTDRYVTSLLPDLARLPLVLAVLVGTLIFFLADEWATRGPGAARGGYWATKLLFLLSLFLAVTLSLETLFFLIIIVPAILILFLVYGVLSGWVYRQTGHPAVGAIASAIAVACAVAVTFPVVAG